MNDISIDTADQMAPGTEPTAEEIKDARDLLMHCSPELTTPYQDRKRPRTITVPQLTRIKNKVLKRR